MLFKCTCIYILAVRVVDIGSVVDSNKEKKLYNIQAKQWSIYSTTN